MLRKILAVIILLIGLLLIFSPFIKNEIVKNLSNQNKLVNFTPQELKENNKKEGTFDYKSVEPPSMTSVLGGAAKYDKSAVIGAISIPSVHVKLFVFKGTNAVNLLSGATTMLADQQMGKENYPLAGHHMRRESMLFGPLMKIKKGAKVYLTNRTNLYIYQIDQTKIVSEKDVSVLNPTPSPTITLITCDKPTKTPRRFVASGKLLATQKLTKVLENEYFSE